MLLDRKLIVCNYIKEILCLLSCFNSQKLFNRLKSGFINIFGLGQFCRKDEQLKYIILRFWSSLLDFSLTENSPLNPDKKCRIMAICFGQTFKFSLHHGKPTGQKTDEEKTIRAKTFNASFFSSIIKPIRYEMSSLYRFILLDICLNTVIISV